MEPTTQTLHDLSHRFAMGEIMTTWGNLTFHQLIDYLNEERHDNPDVIVWEPFEHWRGPDVADYLNVLSHNLYSMLTETFPVKEETDAQVPTHP